MVDKIFTNFFSYLVIGILAVFFVIFILSFLKDLFLEWELESSLTKIYSHMHDIIMIIRENDSEVPLVVYCKNNNLELRIKKVVDSTKGFVVVDEKNGDLVITYYHAACGGATENVSEIWPEVKDVKTLSGVKCDFCKNSPYYEWNYSFDIEKFAIKLKVNGFNRDSFFIFNCI
jgi:hypothetical protein